MRSWPESFGTATPGEPFVGAAVQSGAVLTTAGAAGAAAPPATSPGPSGGAAGATQPTAPPNCAKATTSAKGREVTAAARARCPR